MMGDERERDGGRGLRTQDLFDVRGKVALVTGGSRGIGAMIAEALAVNGAKARHSSVYVSSRKADACTKFAKYVNERCRLLAEQDQQERDAACQCTPATTTARTTPASTRTATTTTTTVTARRATARGSCHPLPADLSSFDGCGALFAAFQRTGEPRLHILVNNAGATWGEALETHPESAWDKLLNLNVKAAFRLVQLFLPLLKAAATEAAPASIINVGSITGIGVSLTDTYSYAASKAAIHHMTRVLASKLAEDHICINAIAPGPFPSKMTKALLEQLGDEVVSAVPMHRVGRPADMAGVTLLLCSRAGAYITGAVIPVDGGMLVKASL
ncbi:short-chain dehydrogenase/reductase SDR [Salpingoeca rosetta]|uniref:Short-chain dehydrogenase/reductase SDR n=1 Tax=Salpingoeca rosetta (strain ATCC 50818 / BSB-021) TaxID=946362 RepID=F2U7N1_SALR5|nr:short-chain dehydrogenase/reductase SDR [Salpingoeca rosetta]EGD83448.1 short-chain dehydrogenase/reductase SDR [Salpingoeca rosetta]|eukprot:XP_004994952.1 short-chain dehydrogenase/reductase SDR [Salpingoeca rosetta]